MESLARKWLCVEFGGAIGLTLFNGWWRCEKGPDNTDVINNNNNKRQAWKFFHFRWRCLLRVNDFESFWLAHGCSRLG